MTILLPIKKSIFSISKYNISSIDFGKFGDDKKSAFSKTLKLI